MAKESKKWSSANIIKFLEAYERTPCLWNHKLSIYRDRNQRNEALRKIVEVMSDSVNNFDVTSAKAKIRSIRNAYILERHKVLKSYKSGTSTEAIYKPTVSWFSVANRFLKGIVETRDAKNALVSVYYGNFIIYCNNKLFHFIMELSLLLQSRRHIYFQCCFSCINMAPDVSYAM